MNGDDFVAEVYRRIALKHGAGSAILKWREIQNDAYINHAAQCYRSLLPANKEAKILDIGFGNGWFMAVCTMLGYQNIHGADFQIASKDQIKKWSPSIIELYDIQTNIGDLLASHPNKYDFIHFSHVIEHIPRTSLFYIVDSIYRALKRNGTLLVRCPNMEGPCAVSSLYVSLGHEYGFTSSNLESLLSLCNFENVEFHRFKSLNQNSKQYIGEGLRSTIRLFYRIMHRLFRSSQINQRKQFGTELIVTARRFNLPTLFNRKYA